MATQSFGLPFGQNLSYLSGLSALGLKSPVQTPAQPAQPAAPAWYNSAATGPTAANQISGAAPVNFGQTIAGLTPQQLANTIVQKNGQYLMNTGNGYIPLNQGANGNLWYGATSGANAGHGYYSDGQAYGLSLNPNGQGGYTIANNQAWRPGHDGGFLANSIGISNADALGIAAAAAGAYGLSTLGAGTVGAAGAADAGSAAAAGATAADAALPVALDAVAAPTAADIAGLAGSGAAAESGAGLAAADAAYPAAGAIAAGNTGTLAPIVASLPASTGGISSLGAAATGLGVGAAAAGLGSSAGNGIGLPSNSAMQPQLANNPATPGASTPASNGLLSYLLNNPQTLLGLLTGGAGIAGAQSAINGMGGGSTSSTSGYNGPLINKPDQPTFNYTPPSNTTQNQPQVLSPYADPSKYGQNISNTSPLVRQLTATPNAPQLTASGVQYIPNAQLVQQLKTGA